MRLTVVIPNYNHSALLPRSLGALVRQRRQADEVIVIDDASTDNSLEVIGSFASRLPNLRVLRNPVNCGVVRTLNRGLREATGDAVYFGGADDATDPDFFHVVLGALERSPQAGLACAEARVLTDAGDFVGFRPANLPSRRGGYVTPGQTAALLQRMDNWVLSVVTILRRDAVTGAGGFDESLAAFCDSFLERRIALETGFVFVPRVLGTWYVQPGSYSRASATNVDRMAAMIAVARDRLKAAEGRPFPPGYHDVFVRRARFASARLALGTRPFDPRHVNALVQGNGWDKTVLRGARHLPGDLGRIAALAWLTLRLRPTSLVRLSGSYAHRWLRGVRRHDRLPG
jgi:GT2 family glycosyltransferase